MYNGRVVVYERQGRHILFIKITNRMIYNQSERGFAIGAVIGIVAVLALLGGGAYVATQSSTTFEADDTASTTDSVYVNDSDDSMRADVMLDGNLDGSVDTNASTSVDAGVTGGDSSVNGNADAGLDLNLDY